MTFEDLTFAKDATPAGNDQALVFFPNGYGASVVIGPFSYGGDNGLYELAVLKGCQDSWGLCYSTPITDDVLGNMEPSDVTRVLGEIAMLSARKEN